MTEPAVPLKRGRGRPPSGRPKPERLSGFFAPADKIRITREAGRCQMSVQRFIKNAVLMAVKESEES